MKLFCFTRNKPYWIMEIILCSCFHGLYKLFHKPYRGLHIYVGLHIPDRLQYLVTSLTSHSYGKFQGTFPSFPIPELLQAAAMRRTGFLCMLSWFISISNSRSNKPARKHSVEICTSCHYIHVQGHFTKALSPAVTAHRAAIGHDGV